LHIVDNIPNRENDIFASAFAVQAFSAIQTKNRALAAFTITAAANFATVYTDFDNEYPRINDIIRTACISNAD